PIDASSRFSMRLPPSAADFFAFVANEAILSLILWLLIRTGRSLADRSRHFYPVLGTVLFALLLIPANGIRTRLLSWRIDILLAALHKTAGKMIIFFVAIAVVPLVVKYTRSIVRHAVLCVLFLAPFAGA